MDFAKQIEHAAWIDWKESSEDALSILRHTYGEAFPAMEATCLDELAENYAAEDTLDHLKAFGQELTRLGLRLYHMEADADAYPLVLIPEREATELEAWCKSHRKKIHLLAQPRRRPGTPARRLDLGVRLPCEMYRLPQGWQTVHTGMCKDALCIRNLRSDPQRFRCALLHLEQNPPRLEELPRVVWKLAGENGMWAARVNRPEKDEKGFALYKHSMQVCAGTDFAGMEHWKVLDAEKEGEDFWHTHYWFHGDLFMAGKARAGVIRKAGAGGSVQLLLEGGTKSAIDFPCFFVRRDVLYLYFQRRFYRWQEKKLFRKADFIPIYTISGETADELLPIGETQAAFVDRKGPIPRSAAEQEVTILDVETGKTSKLTTRAGWLRPWQGRLCVMPRNVRRGEPILQCFDLAAGDRRELIFGALGKSEIGGIYTLSDGRTVLESGNTLYFTNCLWEFMGAMKEK